MSLKYNRPPENRYTNEQEIDVSEKNLEEQKLE